MLPVVALEFRDQEDQLGAVLEPARRAARAAQLEKKNFSEREYSCSRR